MYIYFRIGVFYFVWVCVCVCVSRSSLQLKANTEYVFIFSSFNNYTSRLTSEDTGAFARSRVYSLSVLAISRDTRDAPFEHFHNMAKYFRYLSAGREIDTPHPFNHTRRLPGCEVLQSPFK